MDILNEELIPAGVFAKQFPGRPSTRTVWRWFTKGCRGIRLESVMVGGKRLTSVEAGLRFIEATNITCGNQRSSGDVSRLDALTKAERELDERGVR